MYLISPSRKIRSELIVTERLKGENHGQKFLQSTPLV